MAFLKDTIFGVGPLGVIPFRPADFVNTNFTLGKPPVHNQMVHSCQANPAPNETAARHPPIFSGTVVPVPGLFHEHRLAPSSRGEDVGLKLPGCHHFFGYRQTPQAPLLLAGFSCSGLGGFSGSAMIHPPGKQNILSHKAFFPVLFASTPKTRHHQSAPP